MRPLRVEPAMSQSEYQEQSVERHKNRREGRGHKRSNAKTSVHREKCIKRRKTNKPDDANSSLSHEKNAKSLSGVTPTLATVAQKKDTYPTDSEDGLAIVQPGTEQPPQYDLKWELYKFTAGMQQGQQSQQEKEADYRGYRRDSSNQLKLAQSYYGSAAVKRSLPSNEMEHELSKLSQLADKLSTGMKALPQHSTTVAVQREGLGIRQLEQRHSKSLTQINENLSSTQPTPKIESKPPESCTTAKQNIVDDVILKIFEEELAGLLRELSIAIADEQCEKEEKQEAKSQTNNETMTDEIWCLPYGSNKEVITKRTKEGKMTIRVASIDALPDPEHLASSLTPDMQQENLLQSNNTKCYEAQSINQQSFYEPSSQSIMEQSLEQQPAEELQVRQQDQQSLEQQPAEELLVYQLEEFKRYCFEMIEALEQRLQYPSSSHNALKWQREIQEYYHQLAYLHTQDADYYYSFDDQNNNNDIANIDNDNTLAQDMELSSDNESYRSLSPPSDDVDTSTLQLEISDHDYQRLLLHSRIEAYQHKLQLEGIARKIIEHNSNRPTIGNSESD